MYSFDDQCALFKMKMEWVLNMTIIDYELIDDLTILFKSKIIIYGAGHWAEEVFNCLEEIGIAPAIICQTEITNKRFHNMEVQSISNILDKFDNKCYLLIIASDIYYKEMLHMCKKFEATKVCTIYGFYTSIKLHMNESGLPEKFKIKLKAGMDAGQYIFFQELKIYAVDQLVNAALTPEDYIWIYQPGKVGSQSICNSIQNKSIQFHSLTTAHKLSDTDRNSLEFYLQNIRKKKIKIISAVRELISHDIAAFFQNSDLHFWPFHDFNNNIFWLYGDSNVSLGTQELKKRCSPWKKTLNHSFRNLANLITDCKLDVFSWFDYEIKEVFGIDIYNYAFDKQKGYVIIEEKNVQILIVKMECLSSLEEVISDFISDEKYNLINRNKASEKMYAYTYEKFKKNVRLPRDYFDYYYNHNSKYEHFYSENEITSNYRYWEKYVF